MAAAGEKVYERIASHSAHCRPHQLLFLKALCLLQNRPQTWQKPSATFSCSPTTRPRCCIDLLLMIEGPSGEGRGATILVAVARAHVAFGIAKGERTAASSARWP